MCRVARKKSKQRGPTIVVQQQQQQDEGKEISAQVKLECNDLLIRQLRFSLRISVRTVGGGGPNGDFFFDQQLHPLYYNTWNPQLEQYGNKLPPSNRRKERGVVLIYLFLHPISGATKRGEMLERIIRTEWKRGDGMFSTSRRHSVRQEGEGSKSFSSFRFYFYLFFRYILLPSGSGSGQTQPSLNVSISRLWYLQIKLNINIFFFYP